MTNQVISQTPFRISLGGGGTDLPFYANERGGELISAAVDQYVKVSVANRPLDEKILIQTTKVQFATHLDEIDHELVREALRYFKLNRAIQVATFTTLPTGIGLGSSSSTMVGIVNSLSRINNHEYSVIEIARLAYHIEREILGLAGGVQDQYIAALGGIQIIKIGESGEVKCLPLFIDEKNRIKLQKHLVLVFVGKDRSSVKIIKSQKDLSRIFDVYDEIKEIGRYSVNLLINADIEGLGKAMDRHWEIKKKLSKEISTNEFDELYIKLKKLGSPGGKIIGAGGGGFFLMAVPSGVKKFIEKVNDLGFRNLAWSFEFEGTHLIVK